MKYEVGDYVITKDDVKKGYVFSLSVITGIDTLYHNRTVYTVDDIWIITKVPNMAVDINIDIYPQNIIKKVTKDYTEEDFKKEYPEYLIWKEQKWNTK